MNGHRFQLAGATLEALPSGALWWPEARLLAVADLHLGRSERLARRGGPLLPPYEALDTLDRLAAELEARAPATVLCLGDSFDDAAAADGLPTPAAARLEALTAGRRWIWIAGNHDPGPTGRSGAHAAEWQEGPLVFRHEARAGAQGEVSGHWHPKLRVAGLARPCFVIDAARVILPAFGSYTGGLALQASPAAALIGPGAVAVLTGAPPIVVPLGAAAAAAAAAAAGPAPSGAARARRARRGAGG